MRKGLGALATGGASGADDFAQKSLGKERGGAAHDPYPAGAPHLMFYTGGKTPKGAVKGTDKKFASNWKPFDWDMRGSLGISTGDNIELKNPSNPDGKFLIDTTRYEQRAGARWFNSAEYGPNQGRDNLRMSSPVTGGGFVKDPSMVANVLRGALTKGSGKGFGSLTDEGKIENSLNVLQYAKIGQGVLRDFDEVNKKLGISLNEEAKQKKIDATIAERIPQMDEYLESQYIDNYSRGFIPNFANPLKEAI